MSDAQGRTTCSRRKLLNGGAAFLAGGILGSAAGGLAPAASKEPAQDADDLPWPWAPIDPMGAGSRAFCAYHEAGG